MKTIVCFGDSNTWGYSPFTKSRYPYEVRYTGVLQKLLGPEYRVEEEGMNGRTTAIDDPIEPFRNGAKAIDYTMLTKMPVDLLIIMLGTNDLKRHFSCSAFSVSRGLEQIIKKAKNSEYGRDGQPPKILIISPVEVHINIMQTWVREYIDESGRALGLGLKPYYMEIAQLHGCYFLDAAQYAQPSEEDSVHLEEQEHKKLAEAIAQKIHEIFS